MIIRRSKLSDIEAIKSIYSSARRFMIEQGNPNQWRASYPSDELILADIAEGCSYVVDDGDGIAAVFYFRIGADSTYDKIYRGCWLSDEPYAVIHRVAVAKQGQGIAALIFDHCFSLHPNIRIDTHKDNRPMQHSLEKKGFEYCGIICLENGEERLAYQRIE